MNDSDNRGDELCAIYVDMGTTNTRAWLMRGSQVLSRAGKLAGVRDTARTGSRAIIRAALVELITDLRSRTSASGEPICVTAAGMITSQLGLAEVPHISAPAGIDDVVSAARWSDFPEITDLPILLVPGVRCGPTVNLDSINQLDVMRGEETLCLGLITQGLVRVPCVVLNLGSHWKAIKIGADGKIQASCTSLSGELLHAVTMQTVLAGSLPKDRPAKLDLRWIQAGMTEQRRSGLSRAMFCVRLLELSEEGTPEDRYSFLLGTLVATDLDALVARGLLSEGNQVAICGNPSLAEAWGAVLTQRSIPATILSVEQREHALLAGLRSILLKSDQQRRDHTRCSKQVARV